MGEQKNGVALIAAERQRQTEAEGWTPEHDDTHTDGALALAAAHYAISSLWWPWNDFRVVAPVGSDEQREKIIRRGPPDFGDGECYGWPFSREHWKPKGQVEDLIRAGALIAAEIDRLQRASEGSGE